VRILIVIRWGHGWPSLPGLGQALKVPHSHHNFICCSGPREIPKASLEQCQSCNAGCCESAIPDQRSQRWSHVTSDTDLENNGTVGSIL